MYAAGLSLHTKYFPDNTHTFFPRRRRRNTGKEGKSQVHFVVRVTSAAGMEEGERERRRYKIQKSM